MIILLKVLASLILFLNLMFLIIQKDLDETFKASVKYSNRFFAQILRPFTSRALPVYDYIGLA